jgi:hypothetical protein
MSWRPHLRGFSVALALLAGLSNGGCASSGFDGHVYHDGTLRFRVGQVPPSWRAIDVDDARLAFRDDDANATIAVNARCGVDGDDVPLTALTQHLFLEFTERAPISEQTVALDGREALRSELTAALDGVRKRYVVYVLKKDGCVYDFMYIAAADSAGGARPEFEHFVQGFSTLE